MPTIPKLNFLRICTALLAAAYFISIIAYPRWVNPVELFIISFLVFASVGQAKELTRRMFPFMAVLMTYEAFRGIADNLNTRVSYQWLIDADRWLFGGQIPTLTLQEWLWRGSARWYDMLLYLNYMLHFIVPWALAIVIWKKREVHYWRYVAAVVLVSYLGFITFLIMPAAPPWLASNIGLISETADIVGSVWSKLNLNSAPEQVQFKIAPNPVAAVPSLHAAYATMVVIYSFKIFKNHWLKYVSLVYFSGIMFGAVYLSQHYVIDLIIGIVYAVVAFMVADKVVNYEKVKKLTKSKLRWS